LYGQQINSLQIDKVSFGWLNDQGLSAILSGCLSNGTVSYSLKQVRIGAKSVSNLVSIISSRNTMDPSIFVNKLSIDSCKISPESVSVMCQAMINSHFVLEKD
jgi:hypothetical protein